MNDKNAAPHKESVVTGTLTLGLQIEDGVAHITFERPAALNALNRAMAEAFRDAVASLAADASIRVVVLQGAGRAFMAGGDLAELAADPLVNTPQVMDPLHQAIRQLAAMPVPVIARLHGAVAGAGMSLALAADLAMAADDTVFQMAYCRVGASPDGSGTWHLARLVGLRKAMELTLLSESVDARQALALGMVNWVVPAAELDARVAQLTERLAAGAVAAFGRSKTLLRDALLRDLPEQLAAERRAFLEGAAGPEFQEGVTAFLQKRPTDFRGATGDRRTQPVRKTLT